MLRRLVVPSRYFRRSFCTPKIIADKANQESAVDYKHVKHQTKVPVSPVSASKSSKSKVEIDNKTIQLLERLSLVDLDSKEALKTLQDSIEFANNIVDINTENVFPIYTVLEDQELQLRDDIVNEGNIKDEILKNAKVTEEDYFVAPPGNIPLAQQEKKFD